MSHRRCGVVTLLIAVLAVILTRPAAADVLAAADGRHVFVVRLDVDAEGWEVVHFDATVGPDRHRTVFRTPRRPEAIAVAGDRCVLVLAPVDAERPVRLGVSFRVVQHPLNDVWYADPPGDPRVLPPLPRGGEVGGLVASFDDRMLVFTPSQRSARGVSRSDVGMSASEAGVPASDSGRDPGPGESPDEAGDAGPAAISTEPVTVGEGGGVFRIRGTMAFDWESLPSPDGFEKAIGLVTATVPAATGPVPMLVWQDADDVWHAARFEDGAWVGATLEGVGDGEPASLLAVGDRTLLAVRTADELRLLDLVPSEGGGFRPRLFASLGRSLATDGAVAVGTAAGPWIIGLDGGKVRITTVDRVDGRAADPVVATEVEVDGSLIEFPIYATLMFSVMLAALLLRPHVERQPGVPVEGLRGAGLLRRAAGLCVDLAPGMMAAVVVFDLDPAGFLEEVQAGDPRAVAPVLFGTAVASVLSGVLEVLFGRSLGKLLVGLRVVALDGSPGTRLQRGLRAGLRFVILMFWPIGVLAVLDPDGRGMPELLSRTVVVPARPSIAPATSASTDDRSDEESGQGPAGGPGGGV